MTRKLKQKFKKGQRVKIADDLGPCMSHFPKGVNATIVYTYAQKYPYWADKDSYKDYCLNVDGHGEISWYEEHQLTAI